MLRRLAKLLKQVTDVAHAYRSSLRAYRSYGILLTNLLIITTTILFLQWRYSAWQTAAKSLTVKEQITVENDALKTIAQVVGGSFFLITAYFSWRSTRTAEEGQITERFNKAVINLGESDSLAKRLGGIYALERIARDSRKDHWTIMEILTAYVRENAPRYKHQAIQTQAKDQPQEKAKLPTDIQAILTVLSRRIWQIEEKEAHNILNLSETDLHEAKFSGADLQRADLQRADLKEANLQRADLQQAHLQEANLMGANLSKANLTETYLWKANLRNSTLEGANLRRARLMNADISVASLAKADLSQALLTYTNLSGAFLGSANLRRADLEGANLKKAMLPSANLSRAHLVEVDLSGADLSGADLKKAILSGANLSRANLEGADLEGANLSRANLEGADLTQADLSGADLTQADLSGADLGTAAGLSLTQIEGAITDQATKLPIHIRGVLKTAQAKKGIV